MAGRYNPVPPIPKMTSGRGGKPVPTIPRQRIPKPPAVPAARMPGVAVAKKAPSPWAKKTRSVRSVRAARAVRSVRASR